MVRPSLRTTRYIPGFTLVLSAYNSGALPVMISYSFFIEDIITLIFIPLTVTRNTSQMKLCILCRKEIKVFLRAAYLFI
jgi:hypothetical protein